MITGNEQAYPISMNGFIYGDGSSELPYIKDGLTIRQHFAAMAMQGIVTTLELDYPDQTGNYDNAAKQSVKMADALINELNKER